MSENPEVLLSGFADESANHKTAVEQFAAFAALAGACGKNVTGPSPESYGDGTNCVIINGHLICN